MSNLFPDTIPLFQRGHATKGSLLFLHANSYSAELYQNFLKPLESEYLISAPDLPGHGKSNWAGRIDDWERLADYYLDVLDLQRTPTPLIGMGHSIGGILTLFMALKRPKLFSRIILLDPVLLPKRILYAFRFMHLISMAHLNPISRAARRRKQSFPSREKALQHYSKKKVFENWQNGYLQAYVDSCMRQESNGSVHLACSRELESSIYQSVPLNAWSLPNKISIPALYIIGAHSDTINQRGVKRLRTKIGKDQVKVIEGGHLFPFEDPVGTMNIVKEFLNHAN
jgi:pimeloyl-ACP methyl ester carboxylesterase